MRHTMVVVETSLPVEGTIDDYRRSRSGRRRLRRPTQRPARPLWRDLRQQRQRVTRSA
jgi:hypothetical protein